MGIDVVGGIVGFSVVVGSALAGAGVYALVWGSIAGAVVGSLLNWWLLSKSYRPGFRFRTAEIRPFLNYGIYMVGNNLANTFTSQADVLMGGRWLSVSTLGVFSLPRDLSLRIQFLINSVVTRVGFPVMAQAQNDPALLQSIFLKTLRMTASINFPIYLGISAFTPEIVIVLFGSKWTESVSLLRILALWGLVRSTHNPVGSLIFAVGRVRLAFFWNVSLVPVVLMTYWAGLQYGAAGLAWSMLAYVFALSPIAWYVLVRPACGATFSQYYLQLLLPALCSAGAIFMGYIVASSVTEKMVSSGALLLMGESRTNESILRLAIGVIAAAPAYLLFSRILNRAWFDAMVELLMGKR
jgi:O-antigen/teichoic acid export membrane protein